MKFTIIKKILLICLIPSFLLFAQTLPTTTTNANESIKEVEKKNESVDSKLQKQFEKAQEVVSNINDEVYLLEAFDSKDYNTRINYLENRININEREGNDLAVKRDEIELLYQKESKKYIETLKELIDAKKSFKEKEYFEKVIQNNIDYLKNNNYERYKKFFQEERNNDNNISNDLVQNYLNLKEQTTEQLFILNYLKDNIHLYRKTNFFIDNFNVQYLVSVIDSYSLISPISSFTSYHFKFTVGDIVVVLFILLVFRLFITKIIALFISLINRLFIKPRRDSKKDESQEDDDDEEEEPEILEDIEESIRKPFIIGLYTLSIQLSLYILIKDPILLAKILPWINTFYMGLFTWAIYSLLSNSITNFAEHLVERYPNVRSEMIVFLLRVTKVLFILFVLLFLFTQLGIDVKAIAASVGVGGIAIALASKDTLANFFGSLNIMTDNSFSQGDWIVANNVEGTVVDIRMRTTRIRTFDNAMITIPNSELANTHIKNYSKRRIGRRIKMTLNITYESHMDDIYNLKKQIEEMLHEHPGIASERTIKQSRRRKFEVITREDLHGVKRNLMVYIDEYGASSINIMIYCFSRSPDWEEWLAVKEDLIMKINKLTKENNCDFAYPTQTLFMKK